MSNTRVVIGLGFGDEGKGMAVAHETERTLAEGLSPMTVRFNGGPQAAHNVRIRRDGEVLHHTHSQFGSGAMLGAETVLTKGMLFAPHTLAPEAAHLAEVTGLDAMRAIVVDDRCPVVLPMHARENRRRESLRGAHRHGSTGMGIGVAREHEKMAKSSMPELGITAGMLCDSDRLASRMVLWHELVRFEVPDVGEIHEEALALSRCMRSLVERGLRVVEDADEYVRDAIDSGEFGVTFEGSQGIMLDERFGYYPHVTYGDMTAKGAFDVLNGRGVTVLGITRSYQTRHGDGPMPTEERPYMEEPDNPTYEWAGEFRTGLLDVPMLAKTSRVVEADEIAVSCMDRYPHRYVSSWDGGKVVTRSDDNGLVNAIEGACDAPVTVVGLGNTTDSWIDV